MNKSNQDIIIYYVEANRKLLEIEDVFINNVVEELLKIHPDINEVSQDDPAVNWAYDIINANNNQEVIETLNRLKLVLEKKRNANNP